MNVEVDKAHGAAAGRQGGEAVHPGVAHAAANDELQHPKRRKGCTIIIINYSVVVKLNILVLKSIFLDF